MGTHIQTERHVLTQHQANHVTVAQGSNEGYSQNKVMYAIGPHYIKTVSAFNTIFVQKDALNDVTHGTYFGF